MILPIYYLMKELFLIIILNLKIFKFNKLNLKIKIKLSKIFKTIKILQKIWIKLYSFLINNKHNNKKIINLNKVNNNKIKFIYKINTIIKIKINFPYFKKI